MSACKVYNYKEANRAIYKWIDDWNDFQQSELPDFKDLCADLPDEVNRLITELKQEIAHQQQLAPDELIGLSSPNYVFEPVFRKYQNISYRVGRLKNTEVKVTAKVLDITGYEQAEIEKIRHDLQYQTKLSHPHLSKVFDFWEDRSSQKLFTIQSLETKEEITLEDYIEDHGAVSEKQALFYLSQLISGIKYLNANQIIHRNINPQTIWISGDLIQIAGFREAVQTENEKLLLDLAGERHCMPPEMILCMGYNGSADLWSLGIVLYFMVTGQYPFRDEDEFDQCRLICTADFDLPDAISAETGALIEKLLNVNRCDRICLNQIECEPACHILGNALSDMQDQSSPGKASQAEIKFSCKNQLELRSQQTSHLQTSFEGEPDMHLQIKYQVCLYDEMIRSRISQCLQIAQSLQGKALESVKSPAVAQKSPSEISNQPTSACIQLQTEPRNSLSPDKVCQADFKNQQLAKSPDLIIYGFFGLVMLLLLSKILDHIFAIEATNFG